LYTLLDRGGDRGLAGKDKSEGGGSRSPGLPRDILIFINKESYFLFQRDGFY